MLNDEIIRSRLPGTKQQKLHDTKGLYLLDPARARGSK
jgi:hypothetical protein